MFGHANPWVLFTERGLESVNAVENDSNNQAQPNLCEGINGIPFGGDPGWVRPMGAPTRTRRSCKRGQVLPDLNYKTNPFVTHTDAVQPLQPRRQRVRDARQAVRHLLASGNFEHFQDVDDPIGVENEHSMIELEWERSGVPFYAYPAQSDRITVWGLHVWDCGHGEDHIEVIPTRRPKQSHHNRPPDRLPDRDPLARRLGGVPQHRGDQRPRPVAADRQEGPGPLVVVRVHRPQGVATTLPSTPLGNTPVQATVADAFFSTYGGNIPESLNGCDDSTAVPDETVDAPCLSNFGEDFGGPSRCSTRTTCSLCRAAEASTGSSWCGSRWIGVVTCRTALEPAGRQRRGRVRSR